MKTVKTENWIRIMSNSFSQNKSNNYGKWMFFTEDRVFAEKMCKKAIKEKVCEFTKYRPEISEKLSEQMLSIYKKAPRDSVVCFYCDSNDFETHKKILNFFKKQKILRKTSKNVYVNISFKLDAQTITGQFSNYNNFVPCLQLSDFMDLKTGKWKKEYTTNERQTMIIAMLKSAPKPNVNIIDPETGECKLCNPFYSFDRYSFLYELNLSGGSNLISLMNGTKDVAFGVKRIIELIYKKTWDEKHNRSFIFCDGVNLLKEMHNFLKDNEYISTLTTSQWNFPVILRKKYCCFAQNGVLVGISFWYKGILFQFFNRNIFNINFPKFNLLINDVMKPS